jgi:hypothetical protein
MIALCVFLPFTFVSLITDMMDRIIETLVERGMTEPYHHAVSRPYIAEAEATVRILLSTIWHLVYLCVLAVSCDFVGGTNGYAYPPSSYLIADRSLDHS